MAIEGIDRYARCLNCGDVCWTVASPQDQAVVCSCGFLKIKNGDIIQAIGSIDTGFGDEQMQEHLDNGG
jgi:hypothetical protein